MNRPTNLAEGRWLWRRLYVFLTSGAIWLMLARLSLQAPPQEATRLMDRGLSLLGLLVVLYLVAPTAQQMLAGLSGLSGRSGRSFSRGGGQ